MGEDVTLRCKTAGYDQRMVYWHKLEFGFMIETIAFGSSPILPLQREFNSSRFKATKSGNEYFLEIKNVSKEDQATYFCQAGTSYTMSFINGSHLVVKGSDVESVSAGNKVNPKCSLLLQHKENPDKCLGDQRVYLYRPGLESEPDIIYTTSSRCDDQEGRRCVFHMSKAVKNSSDPGLYSCAVSACREILFGEEMEAQKNQGVCPYAVILGTLLACCVLANLILILTWKRQNPVCNKCKDGKPYTHAESDGPDGDQQTDLGDEDDGLNYVALEFSSRKSKRQRSMRESKETCIYASRKDYH
ncbi:Ig kappa chain V-V region HP R16.7 [Oryzias melastigma]|uniref:Ig kappa chain V-V region HP R16.7 n=1 Tax=Oryzias melastigma TaxID=30732 RepID=A0A834FCZ1_ORYME|nr:Ig kappa chain V-V region HP R16.7 [Oryzias melastigma]